VIIFSALGLAALVVFAPLVFGTRALTDDERSAAEPLFGESIRYEAVRIRSGGPLTWFGAGVTIGNVTRNQFRGPGGWTLDASLFRSIAMGGHRRLELRVEAGNIFNHPVFGNPDTNVQSGTFGQIFGIPGGGGTINANASYVERQIRLGVRFAF